MELGTRNTLTKTENRQTSKMHFQTAILAIFAAAQLGLAAPASDAGGSTLDGPKKVLTPQEECEMNCYNDMKIKLGRSELTCHERCKGAGVPKSIKDAIDNY
ncbi:hypothetical protein PgNI_10366 [Pyricularia grisea]|uniref:Uncharacterized protein n=1 Tax=Pyricularia grisea TaxID=148305 RepID=A0A6P8AY24_PYRGI|nr:hypothetical protein PgNI_10366 [Pyricularia grisea]TLD07248.1 hypothetical protein PgNI_10366 [Pyricularia grisea]